MSNATTTTDAYTWLMKDLADPRTNKWPLVAEPWGVLGIISVYFYLVLNLLPNYMADRKPYSLRNIIQAYNIYQVVACIIMIYGVATSGWTTYYSIRCEKIDLSDNPLALRMASFIWWHMLLKMSELVETIFFILRKKFSQVSVLHVYHHTSTFFISWICCKYFPGGMFTFTVLLNSSVHVFMYAYYYLASLGPEWTKRLQPVKSKLTIMQIIQLVILFLYTLQLFLPGCGITIVPALIYLPNLAINIFLFFKFYAASYRKKKAVD